MNFSPETTALLNKAAAITGKNISELLKSPTSDRLCECGCGNPTPIAQTNWKRWGWIKGQPMRFVRGHTSLRGKGPRKQFVQNVSGLCRCGCGKPTLPAKYTSARMGWLKGEPVQFIAGHNGPPVTVIHGENFHRKKTPEYQAYINAKARCKNDPTREYWKDYAGRGIEFKFTSFAQFLAELGRRPTPEHSIDRKNNDGHYEPGNVRWATPVEQTANQRPKRPRQKTNVSLPMFDHALTGDLPQCHV